MSPLHRVVVAGAVSVLLHGLFFAVMALSSDAASSSVMEKPGKPEEPKEAEEPLEIVFRPAMPEPTPEPTPALPQEKPPEAMKVVLEMEAVSTSLDPENLKKSEQAPENPEFLAAHHSKPGKSKSSKSQPPEVKKSAPEPAFRTAAATPSEEQPGQTDETAEEEGGLAAIGAWKKAVANAIGTRWNFYRRSKMDLLALGSVRISFHIDAKGRVANVRVLSNTGSPTNALYAVRSATEAEIPPIPEERLARVPQGRVEVELTLTIFPNP